MAHLLRDKKKVLYRVRRIQGQLAAAELALRSIPAVSSATVKGRWMGRTLILEVEGNLPGSTTLAAAREIGEAVEAAVLDAVEEARQVRWIPR